MSEQETARVVERYNDAFQRHDPALLRGLVADGCVLENSSPAPRGARQVGPAALAFWSGVAGSPANHFEVEDVFVAGERAVIRWRLRWGTAGTDTVRGVNLMRVRGGQIVEAMGYVKA